MSKATAQTPCKRHRWGACYLTDDGKSCVATCINPGCGDTKRKGQKYSDRTLAGMAKKTKK